MPRAGLSGPVLIAQAADLADELGYEGLTLAALAARFGVAVPSLYKHVEGLDGVRRGVTVLALGELGEAIDVALEATCGDDAGARLRAVAAAFRAYAMRHPGRYAATLRAAAPTDAEHVAASERVLRSVLGLLAERGLTGDEAVDAARALRSALHGFVALEAAGGFGLPRDVERSFDRLLDWLDAGFGAAR